MVLEKAFNIYQKEQKKTFKFFEVWNLLKSNKKWQNLKTSDEHINSGSKRSRTSEAEHTSSDARVGFDLNEDEPVQVSPPSRPMGRDKTKNKGKGKVSELDDLKEMGYNVQDIKYRINKFLKLVSNRESRKQRDSDLKVLSMDTSNLTGDAVQVVLQMKEDMKKRYANRG